MIILVYLCKVIKDVKKSSQVILLELLKKMPRGYLKRISTKVVYTFIGNDKRKLTRSNLKEGYLRKRKTDSTHRELLKCPQKELNWFFRGLNAIYTYILFISACYLTPFLLIIGIVTNMCRRTWFAWLERKYKNLEFVRNISVRTAVDTHRNQGIITLLLQMEGPCQINFVKNRIQGDIIERSRRNKLVFPHLRNVLTSRWGCYAWVRGSDRHFILDNHICMANPLFKGRPVNESNIQDYVTNIVSKLLPPEIPPWKITLIPSQPNRSYLLVRLHHLYLSEDRLTLGDLLMLKENSTVLKMDDYDETDIGYKLMEGIFKPPIVLPQIYGQICESLSNYWNEFVSEYDPLENPSVLKKTPTISTYLILEIISHFSAVREYCRDKHAFNLWKMVKTEEKKRNMGRSLLKKCILNSIHPVNVISSYFNWLFWSISLFFRSPLIVIRMFQDTPVYLYWLYLAHYAAQESWYLFKILYRAPRLIFEEVFLPEHPKNVHQLQTISLCGRKVVSWSDSVSGALVRKICEKTKATPSEVTLAACAAALRDYFDRANLSLPNAIMTTTRFMPREHLLRKYRRPRSINGCGMLCLPLPIDTSRNNPEEALNSMQQALYTARSSQIALFLASRYYLDSSLFTTLLPTVAARAILYLLSRRYAVTLTYIEDDQGVSEKSQLLWGPNVENIRYWRPPQANVCISLTVMNYADNIHLGVMADAQLSPNHNIITENFSSYFENLAKFLGIDTSSIIVEQREQNQSSPMTSAHSKISPTEFVQIEQFPSD